jgi:hypothetical protein
VRRALPLLVLVALASAGCSSDSPGSGEAAAQLANTTVSGAGDRGTVLLESLFVDAAGAGVAGLRIQVNVAPSTPGLSTVQTAASGTTDRDGRFTAAAVPVGVLQNASVGNPVRFMAVAFGAPDGSKWGCNFSRVPRVIPDSGPVVWDDPTVTLVFRPDATCMP